MANCGSCDTLLSKLDKIVGLELYLCSNCGTYNKLPRPTYKNSIYSMGSEYTPNDKEINIPFARFTSLIGKLEKYGKGKLFDVACGMGALVKLAKIRGWESYGNDVRIEIITAAKKYYDIELLLGNFEEMLFKEKDYQVIVFHHGIEHLLHPKKAIEQAIDILKIGGIIYLQHPRIIKEYLHQHSDISNNFGCHHYEWTFEAFNFFVNQFKQLRVIENYYGEVNPNYPDVSPIQEWILQKI